MKEKLNSCYNCRYCTREFQENETWCYETGKVINDGFGEGDCKPCNLYNQAGTLFAFSSVITAEEPLPF